MVFPFTKPFGFTEKNKRSLAFTDRSLMELVFAIFPSKSKVFEAF